MDSKACSKCKIVKPMSEFYGDNRATDGKQSACNTCHHIGTRRWVKNNILERRRIAREYNQRNRDKIAAHDRNRRHLDPQYKVSRSLRSKTSHFIRGHFKKGKFRELIGCSNEEFRQHIEKQFEPWMNWDGYGATWEIDHIKPLCKFNLLDEEQRRICFHYTNCRPLAVLANRQQYKVARPKKTSTMLAQ